MRTSRDRKMRAVCAGLVAATMLAAGRARADDKPITFQVPVKLSNLSPDLKTFSVQCKLEGSQGLGGKTFDRVDLPLVAGGYSGTVAIALTIEKGYEKYVTGYSCKLYLFPAVGNGYEPKPPGVGLPVQQAKPGTTFTPEVSGALP